MRLIHTGDRIDIAGQVLRSGDTIEVSDDEGAALIDNKFPFSIVVPVPVPDPVPDPKKEGEINGSEF